MQALRIRYRVSSKTLELPELEPLIGHDVEIILLAPSEVQLFPQDELAPREPGRGAGTAWMAPDFDDPMPEFAEYM